MRQTKLIILALFAISFLLITGCAPKGAMSNLMKEKGYSEQPQDPFEKSQMVSVKEILEMSNSMDVNYAWGEVLLPMPGDFKSYAKKIVTWRMEDESYFSSLKEFEEASKIIHSQVQSNLEKRGLRLSDGQSLYYYTLKSFEFDKDQVVSDMELAMKTVMDDSKEKSITPLLLVAYADEVGTNKYNIALSQKRAQALLTEFEKLGLKTDKLEILAGGETTDYGTHVENRRGVLVCIVQ